MAAGYQDLLLEQGTTFTTSITLSDSYGQGYNLSAYSVRSQAKRSYYSANATINFETSIYDAANGIVTLSANSAVTSNVSAGKLVYDVILIENTFGSVTRVLEGQIFVSPSVTK